jgi:hypothetical protein
MPGLDLQAMNERNLTLVHTLRMALGRLPPDRQPPQPFAQFPG